jgi:hypothetical protein
MDMDHAWRDHRHPGLDRFLIRGSGSTYIIFDSYSVTHGSLGAVIVLLTWFYLSELALLLGAEINSIREATAHGTGRPRSEKKRRRNQRTVNSFTAADLGRLKTREIVTSV